MADPQTANVGAYVPTVGSDAGTWWQPCNANFSVTDSLAANVSTISLTNSPVTLTTPPNSGAAWAGPYQSQSGILRFTGTLSAACTVTLPRAGFFIVENLCTVGAFYVALSSSIPGNIICAPPGEATHIYNDGTNVKYVDFGRIGSYLDLGTSTVPAWITNCTVQPYLNCDGTTFNATTYPVLNSLLGGNTLPDLRGRSRAALNQTTNRITTAGSGVDGNTLLSSGGGQNQTIAKANLPAYNLTVTDIGHQHNVHGAGNPGGTSGSGSVALVPFSSGGAQSYGSTDNATTGITVNTGGSGTALTTLPPVAIAGLTFIRAG
jgi:hypothetical protein